MKIDVDTRQGYLEGVPRLMEILGRHGLRGTFCIAMGPDNSGKAIRRIFTRPGFLAKMLRTRAVSMYGPRTLLYGTLLPAPPIVGSRPELVCDLEMAGHEVIPHGWDHVDWHDHLARWDEDRTRAELRRACQAFVELAGHPCHGFAAPGWQLTSASVLAQEEIGLRYAADTRGWCPFFPLVNGRPAAVLQLPTTLPTVDELAGLPRLRGQDLLEVYLELIKKPPSPPEPSLPSGAAVPPAAHVFTLHAEVEGRGWAKWFEELLSALRAAGHTFLTLRDLADKALSSGTVPTCQVHPAVLEGRAGTVACQGAALALHRHSHLSL